MFSGILILVIIVGLSVWRIIMSSPENIGKVGGKRVACKLDEIVKCIFSS